VTDHESGPEPSRLESMLGWGVIALLTLGVFGLALGLGWLTVKGLEWLLTWLQ